MAKSSQQCFAKSEKKRKVDDQQSMIIRIRVEQSYPHAVKLGEESAHEIKRDGSQKESYSRQFRNDDSQSGQKVDHKISQVVVGIVSAD